MKSINWDEAEEHIISRMSEITERVDKAFRESSDLRRKLIGTFFVKEFIGTKNVPNPLWDFEAYQSRMLKGEKVRYLTAESALYLSHRAISNSDSGAEMIPYDPDETPVTVKDVGLFFKIWPFGISYAMEKSLLRQIRKGIVWLTIIGEGSVSLETDYFEIEKEQKNGIYKSIVNIPEELKQSITLYEARKSRYLFTNWSIDVGSSSFNNIFLLYSSYQEEIEQFYDCPSICVFAFYHALSDLCEVISDDPRFKNCIGVPFSKKALLDKLAVDEDERWNTRFENGLRESESILGEISASLKSDIFKDSYEICNKILHKYMVSFRSLPDVNDFTSILNTLFEIESNCVLVINFFFKQIGASILERPLLTSGEWKEFKGKEFENFCHSEIRRKHGLKTFTRKVKNEFGMDVGDIDLGILKAPFVFMCDCKNYAMNTKLLAGDVYSTLERIQDPKHGYLGWLSTNDELCKSLSSEYVEEIIKSIGSDPRDFKFVVPLIVLWRPEFFLDIRNNMITNEIPRVCTIFEINTFLDKIPEEFERNDYIITI